MKEEEDLIGKYYVETIKILLITLKASVEFVPFVYYNIDCLCSKTPLNRLYLLCKSLEPIP